MNGILKIKVQRTQLLVFNIFNLMLRGVHYISTASRILLFNILYTFAFIKMMYYEC